MSQSQVRSTQNIVTRSKKIRSAIDLLLSYNSIEVTEPSVKLTECSPDVDVVMNKQGGICTQCNIMFKSKISLMNHLDKCSIKLTNPTKPTNCSSSCYMNIKTQIISKPRLIIVPQ